MQAVYDLSEPAGEEEANTIDLKVQTLALNTNVAAKNTLSSKLLESILLLDYSTRMNICRLLLT